MFAYPVNLMFKSRNPSFYPRTRNFYQPSHPCSYHYNNAVPPYNFYSPYNYYDYDYEEEDDNDEDDDQLLQQLKQQEERERLKRFYEREAREQQAQKSGGSTFTTNHQPRRSFKVKIEGSDDETKSTINKYQAAYKIYNFIKKQKENKQTRKILNKLRILRMIEDELKEVHKTKYVGNLTFDEEHEKQVLPISIENKRFLEYEDKIVKLLYKLDGIQSEGVDIIRGKRKFLVKFSQTLLEELDNEKENQWRERKKLNDNSNMDMDGTLDKVDEDDIASIIEEIAPSSVASQENSKERINTELNNQDIHSNENLIDVSNDFNENQIDSNEK